MSMDDIRDLIEWRDGELSTSLETCEKASKARDPGLRAEGVAHMIVALIEGGRLRVECLRRMGCQETFRLMNGRHLELCEHFDKVSRASGSAEKHKHAKVRASEFRSFGRELVEFTKDMSLVAVAAREFLQLGMD
jgi:hypothetical protein